MEFLDTAYTWFMGLSEDYGVNPLIFGAIYVGAIPFFSLSVIWLGYNFKRGVSIVLPAISATLFFISAYLYLIIVGENVPWWVYLIILLLVLVGGWFTIKKVRRKITHQIDQI
ncbi:MAG: hypothetical protein EA391_05345 [Balneolaceae bacterium]|nr:MAG: hypothetical protein EA391_05345 [Balneolaceae bacterium]